MNQNELKLWLKQIRQIKKYVERISRITGERFNIFNILDVESYEVRLHSRLLAEILNPQGTHGQKDIFLKLFVELLDIKNFKTKDANVIVEKYIGSTNKSKHVAGKLIY